MKKCPEIAIFRKLSGHQAWAGGSGNDGGTMSGNVNQCPNALTHALGEEITCRQ